MSKIILTSLHEIPSALIDAISTQYPCISTTDLSAKSKTMDLDLIFNKENKKSLQELVEKFEVDVIFLKDGFKASQIKVLAFDMDSTLINIECIDEIARECGMVDEVSQITEATMRGEIKNFSESLIARVIILQGASSNALEKVYQQRLRLNPGAQSLIQYAQQQGMKTILVSGGFTFFSDKVKQLLNLDEAHSNTLEIVDGVLTGIVLGQIVDGVCKERLVNEFCLKQNLATSAALVFGDGSNDLLMMESAGLSIGYRPKPIIKEKADGTFNFVGLDGVLDLLKAKA